MLPPSNPNSVTRNQSVPPLVRADSGILVGTQVGSLPLQQPFSSMVSPRSQLDTSSSSNNMSLSGNISIMPSVLNHSLGSRGPVSGGRLAATLVNLQQQNSVGGAVDMLGPAELDPPSHVPPSASAQGQLIHNLSASQLALHHSQSEQFDGIQKFQRSFSMPHNQQQAQLKGGLGNISGVAPVKLEPQMGSSDQNGPPQHLPSSCGIGSVKLEQQPLPSVGGLGPVKLERQQSDSALFLQQQQQQLLQRSRSPSQVAAAQISLLQQQKILQLQQHMLKNLPQQRNQLQRQLQQSNSIQPQLKPMLYEPGMCARRLTHYMYQQKQRPADNNIEFWRKFVAEFFSPNAKKRWCVSCYGSGRQTNGVYPQDTWHCEICNHKPGRGFETTVEFLPRLFQIRYASGISEELLYVDMPREYRNASGQIVLDYGKAIEESVLEQLRVVREGQLRIVSSPDLKICSWEFCARRHEELIPRRLLMPQVSQLGAAVQKHQNSAQSSLSNVSNQDLESTCSSFMETARQLAKALEVPLINDLGYTKGFIRCLQISEVVNIMKDLIDYSRETGTRPMDSLINFPKQTSPFGVHSPQVQQPEDQKMTLQNASNSLQTPACETGMPLSSASNGVMNTTNSISNMPPTCATSTSVFFHQNTMNSRHDNQTSSVTEIHAGNSILLPSTSSSNSLPTSQPNFSSPFSSPSSSALNSITASTSQNVSHLNSIQTPVNMSTSSMKQPLTQAHESQPTESQSSVQRILQEMMMSSQLNGASNVSNKLKGVNGITPALNGGNYLVGGIVVNNSGVGRTAASLRPGLANAMTMNGQVRIPQMLQDQSPVNHQQQQDMGNNLLGQPDPIDNFDDLLFDWNSSP